MSNAIRQSVTLLAVIGGCLSEINGNKMIPRLDLRELSERAYKEVIWIQSKWPKAHSDTHTINWVRDIVDLWEPHVKSIKGYHKLVVLSKVCERCLADLRSKNKSPLKRDLLSLLIYPLSEIDKFADFDGGNFLAYEKCDELVGMLYQLIKWDE